VISRRVEEQARQDAAIRRFFIAVLQQIGDKDETSAGEEAKLAPEEIAAFCAEPNGYVNAYGTGI
jgi:hypothetical protein